MNWVKDDIEKKLLKVLSLNANYEEIDVCYNKCADKAKVKELYETTGHQIIYGRRGTGKTTLLKSLCYYSNSIRSTDLIRCVYIDLENIVPNFWELENRDPNNFIIETYRLLCNGILESLVEIYEKDLKKNLKYRKREIEKIDSLSLELMELISCGEMYVQLKNLKEEDLTSEGQERDLEATLKPLMSGLKAKIFGRTHRIKRIEADKEIHYKLNIKKVRERFDELIHLLKCERIIICIDEFTRIDKGMENTVQPMVAQLIKDTFFRLRNVSVKLTSLWNKSQMQVRQLGGTRYGIELGEDIVKGFDLDTIFFAKGYSYNFFLDLIINACLLNDNGTYSADERNSLKEFIVTKLFKSKDAFRLLICGGQGVPRIFRNLLIESINNRKTRNENTITVTNLYECIINNFTKDVRRKLNYTDANIVCIFDNFVTEHKHRFILVKNEEYESNRKEIEGLVDNNYMHQYPSERVDRKYRNHYKLFLVHYGNYLEALDLKACRQQMETDLYPSIPSDLENVITEYLIKLS